ncbi:MAG: BtaA family protein [Proteobacteria bacterium]|nr:BtaA family protein [Pseudomonadota bacterium]MBU1736703.1 BtaA family protein [Pseudomonadota bacterium]
MDKIENRADFSYIRYANCWEDTEILCRALEPAPGKRFLSIASAGDNSLGLLAEGAEVVATDLNLSQLACVDLRKEAIRKLSHADCLSFFGITSSDDRLQIYGDLRDALADDSAVFWDAHSNEIRDGFIHFGKFERYFQTFRRKILSLIHNREMIATLLTEKTREKRHQFYEKDWANFRWHLLFKIFFSKFVMGRSGRDPEFFRYVEVPVSESILSRTKYALTELETHNNPYLAYILTGNFTGCLPYYLQAEIFEKIKANIDNLTLYLGPVQDGAREQGNRKFDGFNLSDIFEYLDKETCSQLYRILLDHASSGARLAYWNMLVPRECPTELKEKITPKTDLARELFAIDKAFFYSNFIIEEVL